MLKSAEERLSERKASSKDLAWIASLCSPLQMCEAKTLNAASTPVLGGRGGSSSCMLGALAQGAAEASFSGGAD